MKVCPQCRSVFGDDFVYCSNDGSVLVEENLPLPTEADDAEAETVIRRDPIVVDFNQPLPTQAETVEMNYAAPPSQPIVVEKTSNSKFYALFLLVGLLLGGGLVLATLLAARFINRPAETNVSVQAKTGENKNQKTPENINTERDNEVDKLADELHREKDASRPDEDFNGRVIVANANVRAAPGAVMQARLIFCLTATASLSKDAQTRLRRGITSPANTASAAGCTATRLNLPTEIFNVNQG